MKKSQSHSACASALQITICVVLLLVSAILFASMALIRPSMLEGRRLAYAKARSSQSRIEATSSSEGELATQGLGLRLAMLAECKARVGFSVSGRRPVRNTRSRHWRSNSSTR